MIMRRGVGDVVSDIIGWLPSAPEPPGTVITPIGQATETRAVTMTDGSVIGMEFDKFTNEPISTWQIAPPGSSRRTGTDSIEAFARKYWPWLAGGVALIVLWPRGGGRRR